ncbi:MAG: dephospho-CoA kinase [Candidatus Marinimicrobia bacterium]|nr:dephospho-CoA kinase [Candidatus Neomarinimicrobiota bacterium]
MIIIGVTGGMGSGKTLACKLLGELGATVIEADKVGKKLYSINFTLKNKIVEAFGIEILDESGEVSFKKLAAAAFKDKTSVGLLNSITHPFIKNAIREKIIELAISHDVIVVDAALLYEGELLYTVDYIITVTAPEEVRIKRVVDSGRFSEEEVRKRMSFQLSEKEKIANADYVITNVGTIEELRGKVEDVYNKIMH